VKQNGRVEIKENLYVEGDVYVSGTLISDEAYFERISRATPYTDNLVNLGSPLSRWKNVYATNGTIQTSDIREKEEIEDCRYGLKEVLQMRPVSFQWKAHPEQGTKLGLIAQDLLPVLPEVVKTLDYEPVTDGRFAAAPGERPQMRRVDLDRLGVYYSDLIPVLAKAIQEQQAVIEAMQARIDRLEGR
jgi:hypothetical protein